MGDWNGHHSCWDELAEPDARGEWLLEWFDDRGLAVLNDGAVTRRERGTVRRSTPDVSLVSRSVATNCRWAVFDKMLSDHLPMMVEFGEGVDDRKCVQRCVWDWKNGDWEAFRREVRGMVSSVDWESLSVGEFERCLREGVLRAGKRCVGRKVLGRNREPTLSRETLDAIRVRDELRFVSEAGWDEVREAEEKVRRRISEERQARWLGLLENGAS